MKAAKLAIAAMFALTTAFASAQTLTERLFLVRADTTMFDAYAGMTHVCFLLYPDGRYRLEKSFQGMQGGDPETKVYVDRLPDGDLRALQAEIDDGKFQDIKTAPPRGGIIKDMDTLDISVPREHMMQNINFTNAAERKPYEKTLKPFLNSLKNVEKRKVAAAKSEKPDNCTPPQVMYRTTFGPNSSPNAAGSDKP